MRFKFGFDFFKHFVCLGFFIIFWVFFQGKFWVFFYNRVATLVAVERRLLVRQCRETVTADSGKPRAYIRFEKKHELICRNVSTSLKKSIVSAM